jgi:hypothetical protein
MICRDRFAALMSYQPFDRLPVYYFGTWPETKTRWQAEGLATAFNRGNGSGGPQLAEMDPDWETSPDGVGCIWNNQGLLNPYPLSTDPWTILEESESVVVIRTALGGVVKQAKGHSAIPQHLEPDLRPTREDWARFRRFLDPLDPGRRPAGWEARVPELQRRTRMTCFLAGSLYGWLRDWMGVEGISYLAYDDPALLEEMVAYLADYFLALNTPLLTDVAFDFAYFFEDCCGSFGPLLSPSIYRELFDPHYRRMIARYRELGVPFMLMDSDGKIDALLPCWLDSGFDIIFPIEVGVWGADPLAMRRQYGPRLRMMGGVNKHLIVQGEAAVREELFRLKPLVAEGGFIPFPDHRIPPDCSLMQFQTYLRVFREVF